MFIKLFIPLVCIPIVEIYTLLQVGEIIGLWPTIAMIILTGIAGSLLLRIQGLEILTRIQTELAEGRMPTGQLLDGAMVLAGGIVLLTPGFWTDLCGFILLVPQTRALIKRSLSSWLETRLKSGQIHIHRL